MHPSSRAWGWHWMEPGAAAQGHRALQDLPRRGKPRLPAVSGVLPAPAEGKGTHQQAVRSHSMHQDQVSVLRVSYSEFTNQLLQSCLKSHA